MVAPTISWRPTDRFTFNFDFEYQRQNWVDDGGDTAIPAVGNRPANIPISRYLEDPAITTRNRNGQKRVVLAYDWTYEFIDDWKLTNRFAYADTRLSPARPIRLGGSTKTTGVMDRGLWLMPAGRAGSLSAPFHEFRPQGKVVTGPLTHKLLAGFDYFNYEEKFRGHCCDDAFVKPINIYFPIYNGTGIDSFVDESVPDSSKDKWTGVYAQDQISFWDDRIQLLLGGRHDWAETSRADTPIASPRRGRTPRRVIVPSSANSPRVGVLRPAAPLAVGLWELHTLLWLEQWRQRHRTAPLQPQIGVQFEGGVKAELLDGKLIATFAYFDIEKTNITRPVAGHAIRAADRRGHSHGVEFDVTGRFDDNWSVIATSAISTRASPGRG